MTDQQTVMYSDRFPSLEKVARRLEEYVADLLVDCQHIDRISARAKDPDRFQAKAAKRNDDGKPRYTAPLDQIQDQIGARVIVYYKHDVKLIGDALEKYFRHVERQNLVPDSEWEFGYFGRHWIYVLPGDVVPEEVDGSDLPDFFELQVKTLFQHAWSEAEHDLGYKTLKRLTSDQKRRFAYSSAQAWGADRVFDELRNELIAEE